MSIEGRWKARHSNTFLNVIREGDTFYYQIEGMGGRYLISSATLRAIQLDWIRVGVLTVADKIKHMSERFEKRKNRV